MSRKDSIGVRLGYRFRCLVSIKEVSWFRKVAFLVRRVLVFGEVVGDGSAGRVRNSSLVRLVGRV